MAEEQATQQERAVVINGEEHKISDLSQEQINMINQLGDLEDKIRKITFTLVQAEGGRNYFMSLLTSSLAEDVSSDEDKPEAEASDGS